MRVEIHPLDVPDKHNNADEPVNLMVDQNISPAEVSPVQNFLSGKNCLHGASIHSRIHLFDFHRAFLNSVFLMHC